jgi:hypothetical protein
MIATTAAKVMEIMTEGPASVLATHPSSTNTLSPSGPLSASLIKSTRYSLLSPTTCICCETGALGRNISWHLPITRNGFGSAANSLAFCTSCGHRCAVLCAAVPDSLVTINTLLARNQDVQVLRASCVCYQLG